MERRLEALPLRGRHAEHAGGEHVERGGEGLGGLERLGGVALQGAGHGAEMEQQQGLDHGRWEFPTIT